MIGPCVIGPRILTVVTVPRGWQAGGPIVAPAGRCGRRGETMSSVGFVDVMGALEPDAIGRGIAMSAHRRMGEVIGLVIDWLDEQDNGLNQKQKIELASTASMCFDGFERDVVKTLVEECERIRIRETTGDEDA
jgi:hypothetical protein